MQDETMAAPGRFDAWLGVEIARRRGRNRWEYLIGDPAAASARLTRLRIRTVSGSLSIRPRREGDVA